MKNKQLTIVGYYGDNYGDLLMLYGVINNIPPIYSQVNVLTNSSYIQFENLKKFDKKIVFFNYGTNKTSTVFKALKGSDKIMWAGGTCFNDVNGTGAVKIMLIAKLLGKKCLYFGIGVNTLRKFKSKLYLWLGLLVSSNFIVRDEISKEVIEQCNFLLFDLFLKKKIFKIPDLAYLYLHDVNVSNSKLDYDLLISYRNVKKYFFNHHEFLNQFNIAVDTICQNYGFKKIAIIDADKEEDTDDSLYIKNHLQKVGYAVDYIENISLDEKIKFILASNYIICGRLHVAFSAYYFNKPFLLLNYADKNLAFIKEHEISPDYLKNYDDFHAMNAFPNIKFKECNIDFKENKKNEIIAFLNRVL